MINFDDKTVLVRFRKKKMYIIKFVFLSFLIFRFLLFFNDRVRHPILREN